MRRRLTAFAFATLGTACGASEARVASLEAQVAQLSHGSGSAAEADSSRLDRIEDQLAVLQRELANAQARPPEGDPVAPAPAPAAAPAATPAPASRDIDDAVAWASADAAIGVDPGGLTVNGNTYVVRRAWLTRELAALQLPGRAPKLANAPGGVVIRQVKPKSLAAQLGLQNADMVTAIDEHPVTSPADVSSALHAARDGQTTVKVMRKKREVVLEYKLVD